MEDREARGDEQPPINDETTGADSPPQSLAGSAITVTTAPNGNLETVSIWRARRQKLIEHTITVTSTISGFLPLSALLAMLAILFVKAWPAIRYNGWGFFTGSAWDQGDTYVKLTHAGGVLHPVGAHYGTWPLIAGTLESSAIAIIVGFPIAVGAAVLLVEKLPPRPAAAIGLCLEVLAGIPSAVIGFWGIFIFGPWLAHNVYPWLSHMPDVPVLGIFHGDYASNGQGLLTAGLVLACMIIPIIAATTRDLLRQVPETTKEGAEALGMTDAEVFRTVQARWVRVGVIGSAVLGLGRALGETIAIAMISGSIPYLATNIFAGFTSIAATIVTQLDGALTDPSGFEIDSIAEVALVLFVITLLANIGARLIIRKAAKGTALPIGAGF